MIYINVLFKVYRFYEISSSSMKTDYDDQFRYTQHIVLRGPIRDDDDDDDDDHHRFEELYARSHP